MYGQLKNDMMVELTKRGYDSDIIKEVIACLDVAAYKYDITKKETQITLYNQELPDMVKMYLISRKVEGYSQDTLYNYGMHLKAFFLYVQKAPQDVTALDVRVFLHNYQMERGIADSSLDKVRGSISSFFKWAAAEEYLDKDPTISVKSIKFEKKEKQYCTQVELEYLRLACQTPKQRAILELFYSSGCRIAELVNLKKSDIDFQEGTVQLFGKGKKHRVSYINAKAEVALREYLASRVDDNEALFVSDRRPYNSMGDDGVRKIIRLMAERARDNLSHHVVPHALRHTTATTMALNGADITSIQAVLGHSNINTTMVYVHTSQEAVKLDHQKTII